MSNDFDWIMDVSVTLEDVWKNNALSIGDVLSLSGDIYGDGSGSVELSDFRIKITSVDDNRFVGTKFQPIIEDHFDLVDFDGKNSVHFVDHDRVLLVNSHIKYNQVTESKEKVFKLLNEQDDFDWIREIQPSGWVPKEGEKFTCIPGYNKTRELQYPHEIDDPLFGGYGYDVGRVFTVSSVSKRVLVSSESNREAYIIWPMEVRDGIYSDVCTPIPQT